MKRIIWTGLLAAALSAALTAHAAIAPPVSVTSSASTVVLSAGARTTLSWSINYVQAGGPPSSSLRSTQIVFRTLTGALLGTQGRLLTRAVTASGTYLLTESVAIPSHITYRAFQLGSQGVLIERGFVDTALSVAPVTASVALGLSSATTGELLISRVALQFDDDSQAALVPQDSTHKAYALLRTEGNGWLDAVWEIADGSGDQNEPYYRPLRSVRQYLGGGRSITLQSPPLPTASVGRYLVRLRLREPLTNPLDLPVVRYQVMGAGSTVATPPVELVLRQPVDGALLSPETRFVWQAVAGVQAYQLELFDDTGTPADGATLPPLSGALVSAQSTDLTLSPLVQQHLRPGQRIRWRVIAIDERGRVIAESPLRAFQTP